MAERKSVLLRLDPAVYEAVARWAADDLRSVNAQIEYALRRALRAAGRPPAAGAEPVPEAAAGGQPVAEAAAGGEPVPEAPAGGEPIAEAAASGE